MYLQYKILAQSSRGGFVAERMDVAFDSPAAKGNTGNRKLIREFIEPVVHTREIIWYKNLSYSPDHLAVCIATDTGYMERAEHIRILKRETVTYTE